MFHVTTVAFSVLFLCWMVGVSGHGYTCPQQECSCQGGCTRDFWYWKSYNSFSWYSFLRKPWPVPDQQSVIDALAYPHSEDRPICGVKWIEVLKMEVGKHPEQGDTVFGRPQIVLARHWISSHLSIWKGACSTRRIDEIITLAGQLLQESCGTVVPSDSDIGHSMLQLATTIHSYTEGVIGPGSCGCGDGIVQDPEDCDLGKDLNGKTGSCCSEKCELVPVGTVCRPSGGLCDIKEYCTGVDPECPPEAFVSADAICREAVGPCDRPERCTGDGPECPRDGLRRSGYVCREAEGACDVSEVCDGASVECPEDAIRDADSVCRPSAGTCDVPEMCDGLSKECPEDRVLPKGTPCRDSSEPDPCNCIDVCDGDAGICPEHDPLTSFDYAITVDTLRDRFDEEGKLDGSHGTIPWSSTSWSLHNRGSGQQVSLGGGKLNVTFVSSPGISAYRPLPELRDRERLTDMTLHGKVVLSKVSAPLMTTISVAAKPCESLDLNDVVWCGVVRSASSQRRTTLPLRTPSGREVQCDALNLARRLAFQASVETKPFHDGGEGCIAISTGLADDKIVVGSMPTTLLFDDLQIDMRTEVQMKSTRPCGTILVPDPGQVVGTGTCPLQCPGSPGCLGIL